MRTIEQEFAGQGYGDFKPAVGEAVVELLRPIREETERLLADKAYLESVYRAGAEKAAYVANRTLSKVYKKVGFLAPVTEETCMLIENRLIAYAAAGAAGGAGGQLSDDAGGQDFCLSRWGPSTCPRTPAGCTTTPIPRLGGLAIFHRLYGQHPAVCGRSRPEMRSILLGAVIIVVLGVVDDIYGPAGHAEVCGADRGGPDPGLSRRA